MSDRSGPDEPGHYFSAEPQAPSDPSSVDLTLPDLTLSLQTDAGVFGRSGVDAGTKLLLLGGPEPNGDDRHLADLGAGYGPIALALAKRNPNARVWAIEINRRARELCRANADRAGLDNVVVAAPDAVPDDVVFDQIWSNPPIRIGKKALHRLLATWLDRLDADGTAHLVVQKHLGSDSLQRWLTAQGWSTSRRLSKSAYRLLDVEARTPPRDALSEHSDDDQTPDPY